MLCAIHNFMQRYNLKSFDLALDHEYDFVEDDIVGYGTFSEGPVDTHEQR